jgi:cell wall-associated NlpC family hydrolase
MKYFFDNDEAKARLLNAAGKWIGTPFHPHACIMGVGVDCVHVVAAIYQAAGVMKEFNPPAYVMDGGHHDESSKVIQYVERTGRFERNSKFRTQNSELCFGDLLCFRLGRVEYHVGVKLAGNLFLQAIPRLGVNIYTLQDSTWRNRLTAIYRPLSINHQLSTIN